MNTPHDNTPPARMRPVNVGIKAMEVYFPSTYVNQQNLEVFDRVSKGKYTIGLGQTNMGFCSDREDIGSICLTVLQNLMEKYHVQPESVGRLEVGTESRTDKSKAIKTLLMKIFEESGNTDMDGADVQNACYGGTAAVFNACNWVESASWDGRFAVVVCGDIAVYAEGNARPTGGCGAVAMLIGPNAPLVIDPVLRAFHMEHAYDFYKPHLTSEYPEVNGPASIKCYLKALDLCFARFRNKSRALNGGKPFDLRDLDYCLFHSPFNKLVQKSFARLVLADFLADPARPEYAGQQALNKYKEMKLADTYTNREIESVFMKVARPLYDEKVAPGVTTAKEIGNMYTASLWGSLVSLLNEIGAEGLRNRRVMLFSYGSGLTSALFAIHVNTAQMEALHHIVQVTDLKRRLACRVEVSPAVFNSILKEKESLYGTKNYAPKASIDGLVPGTFYLVKVDEKARRTYARKPHASMSRL